MRTEIQLWVAEVEPVSMAGLVGDHMYLRFEMEIEFSNGRVEEV